MVRLLLFFLACFCLLPAFAQQKPNIIVILADDMGYADLGCYGGEIHTPHLDKLAQQGVRLRQFYNNSICAPTRASLITGQYAHKAGMGYFNSNLGLPSYQGYLNKESLTFAEVLKQGGYQTYLSGKWHVGGDSSNREWPTQRGFDHFFGFLGGASAFMYPDQPQKGRREPGPFYEDRNPVSFRGRPDFYATDIITDYAVRYINVAAAGRQPFFLYLSYNAPHWPLQAPAEDIARYKGVYDIGWDSLRAQRFARQKELGVVAPTTILSVKDHDIPHWKDLTWEEQRFWARKMEVYAAMVDRMDQGVGRVLQALEATKTLDNTLIVFLSDNGAPVEDVDRFMGAAANDGPVGTAGSYESQSRNWSYASNTPFRGFKSYAYEGGISTPLIAWYPKKIKAGQLLSGSAHIIDLAPTLYDIAGVSYPVNYKGHSSYPLAGRSLRRWWFDAQPLPERSFFGERAGNRVVLQGRWKLVSIYPSYRWELYDISTDRGETTDLSAQYREKLNELSRLYFDWARQQGVVDFNTIRPVEPLIPTADGKGVQAY